MRETACENFHEQIHGQMYRII